MDEDAAVFIVRLWYEPREIKGAMPLLRGTIEHVSSGKRWHVKDLKEILCILARHVEQMQSP